MHLVKTYFIEKFRCAQYNFTHIPGIIYFHMGSFSEKNSTTEKRDGHKA